jgi:hypothetical protein
VRTTTTFQPPIPAAPLVRSASIFLLLYVITRHPLVGSLLTLSKRDSYTTKKTELLAGIVSRTIL